MLVTRPLECLRQSDIRDDLASRNFMETKWKKGRTGGLGYYVGESKQRVIFDLVALVNKGSG